MVALTKTIHDGFIALNSGGVFRFDHSGGQITAYLVSDHTKLVLISSVFQGEGYIPESVRKATKRESLAGFASLPTTLKLDEGAHEVSLRYMGKAEKSESAFLALLEEFSALAEEWRLFLEDRGGDDLLYVKRSS